MDLQPPQYRREFFKSPHHAGLGLATLAALCWRPASPAADLRQPQKAWLRWARFAVGALPGLSAAIVVIALDQEQSSAPAYGAALAAGVAVLVALLAARARVTKMFSSFSAF